MLHTQINSLRQSLKNWKWLSSEELGFQALSFQQPSIRRWLLISTLLLLGCSGCASLSGSLSQSLTPALEFRMNPVQSGDRPGLYTVSGQTTLPNKTQVTVSAVRYLPKVATDQSPSYTLLDRQFAQVSQGAWKTDLDLWQTANGKREVWQSSLQGFGVQSNPEVVFLATVDPLQQSTNLQNQLDRLDDSRQLDLVRFTSDGEQYLQVSQALEISPPNGTVPAVTTDRTPQVVPVLQTNSSSVDEWKQLPLPLSPDEFLR
ncbi:MAG: hypothetical protein KME15_23410 [Drouetiella hepatica Uher 2000/2452]|jgi:hypothetical protein|uniref:Uncharacterized protein n=1 Tax=Drouetiella hepatica Uher 2000/2452 TaxID=904376 RepID=A0A951URH7_9CYAN|nr:hypothetical protein [Drouetiella hepatica Uher 2000/2452]